MKTDNDKVYDKLRMDFTPTEVFINVRSSSSITRWADRNDDWDRDDTYTDHTINGISLSQGNSFSYESMMACFRPTPGEVYYLVYANYDTGDTFGRDQGNIDFVDLYTDETLAWDMARMLEREAKEGQWVYNVTMQNGNTYKYYAPYVGYFDNLNYVRVEAVLCER